MAGLARRTHPLRFGWATWKRKVGVDDDPIDNIILFTHLAPDVHRQEVELPQVAVVQAGGAALRKGRSYLMG